MNSSQYHEFRKERPFPTGTWNQLTKRKCLRLGIVGYWRVVKVWDLQVKSIKTEVEKLFKNISNVRMFGQLECTGHTDDYPSSWSSMIYYFTVERNGAGKKVNMRALELGLYLVQTTETFERISLKRVIQTAYLGTYCTFSYVCWTFKVETLSVAEKNRNLSYFIVYETYKPGNCNKGIFQS
jgi:hypothetical protein